MTSIGSTRTSPPPSRTACAVASMSSVRKYTVHAEVAPGFSSPTAATVLPSDLKNPYPPVSGPSSWNSHPKTAR